MSYYYDKERKNVMDNQKICKCTSQSLAMASVPEQEWCEPYDLGTSLYNGTLFPSLNLKFYAAEEIPCPVCEKSTLTKGSKHEEALMEIFQVGFAINDLTLYLDTHPSCQKGIEMMRNLLEKRLNALADYAKNYVPLTQLSIVTGETKENEYGWDEGPLPWDPFGDEGGLL